MACVTCFCSESGMILMVKASDRSLVMENTALMALKATRVWGESEAGGKSAVVTSCHWKNRRLIWAECIDVTWLLVGLELDQACSEFHMKNVLALISETYALTTLTNRRTTESYTARELKHQLKKNVALNEIIDFLVLGFSAPTKEIFLDVTGYQDSAFVGSNLFDRAILHQLAEDVGADGCFLLHSTGVVIADSIDVLPAIQKSILILLAQQSQTSIEIYLDGAKKFIYTFQYRPEFKLVGIMKTENREKWMQCGLKFCRKHEKTIQIFDEQGKLSTAEFFIQNNIQGFLILCKSSRRCWSSVRSKWDQIEDNRTVFRRIQILRQIFARTQATNSDDNGYGEFYEINRSYASYVSEENGFQVMVLLQPEVSISAMITIGRNFLAFAVQKLNSTGMT